MICSFILDWIQEEEVTEELLTFHEAVYHMQEQEEELIDTHHQLTEVPTPPSFVELQSEFLHKPGRILAYICLEYFRILFSI